MSQSMRTLLPILALSAVAVLSTWYLRHLEADLYAQDNSLTLAPRLIGDALAITVLNEEGGTQYRIRVSRAVQGPRDSGVDLVRPEMQLYTDDAPDITVRSDKGWLAEDQSLLRLMDAVRVQRVGADGEAPSTLSTEYLEIHPKEEVAETPKPVRISMPGHVVDAIGMRVDLARMHLELQNQVRGQHEFESY